MGSVGDGTSRMLRSGMFALTCTGLAAAAHATAHGGAPTPAVLLAVAGGLTLLALPFTGSGRGFASVAAAMVAVQAGLHTLFGLALFDRSAEHMRAALAPTLCVHGGHPLSGAVLRQLLRTQAPLLPRAPTMPVAPWSGGPVMLGGHLLAALVTALLLHRCDLAVATAAALVTIAAGALAGPIVDLFARATVEPVVVGARRPPRWPGRAPTRRPPPCWLPQARVRRGPPFPLTAAVAAPA